MSRIDQLVDYHSVGHPKPTNCRLLAVLTSWIFKSIFTIMILPAHIYIQCTYLHGMWVCGWWWGCERWHGWEWWPPFLCWKGKRQWLWQHTLIPSSGRLHYLFLLLSTSSRLVEVTIFPVPFLFLLSFLGNFFSFS